MSKHVYVAYQFDIRDPLVRRYVTATSDTADFSTFGIRSVAHCFTAQKEFAHLKRVRPVGARGQLTFEKVRVHV